MDVQHFWFSHLLFSFDHTRIHVSVLRSEKKTEKGAEMMSMYSKSYFNHKVKFSLPSRWCMVKNEKKTQIFQTQTKVPTHSLPPPHSTQASSPFLSVGKVEHVAELAGGSLLELSHHSLEPLHASCTHTHTHHTSTPRTSIRNVPHTHLNTKDFHKECTSCLHTHTHTSTPRTFIRNVLHACTHTHLNTKDFHKECTSHTPQHQGLP